MRKVIKSLLGTLEFFHASEAVNGSHAMEILETKYDYDPIQLIIADWNMPDKTGLDLLYEVRCDPHFLDIPFIMVTVEADIEQVRRAVKAGVNSYLIKPFDAVSLEKKILQIFNPKLRNSP